jgi:hypothetical protein
MAFFKLEETGELPLEFDGECIFKDSSQWVNGQDRNRYHKVSIYVPDDRPDERILHVRYITHWQGESDHAALWELGSAEDVIQTLNDYDPIKYLIGFPKSDHFRDKQRSLESQIKSDWLKLKTKALQSLGVKRSRKPNAQALPQQSELERLRLENADLRLELQRALRSAEGNAATEIINKAAKLLESEKQQSDNED